MKTVTLAFAFALIPALAACGEDDANGGPAEGSAYEVVLPDGWTDDGGPGLAGTAVEIQTGADLEAVWAREEEVDDIRPNVNVTSDSVPAGSSADQVADSALQALIDRLGGDPGFDGTRIGEVTPATLGGDKAAELEIASVVVGDEIRQRITIAVRGGKAYAVTQTAAASAFDEVAPQFDEILESWRWTS